MEYPGFSTWTPWNNRLMLDARNGPGAYLLARFEDGAPDPVDPCDQRVILIAETHDQTLQRRWDQFAYSAFKGGDGHAGGRTFYRLFTNGVDSAVPPWLYVSASMVPPGVDDVKSYARDVKRQL